MINGIEGIPGSGKSYEAVAYHVLPALKSGRKVITNLPLNISQLIAIDPSYADLIEIRHRPSDILGIWDASDIATKPAFQLFEDGRTEKNPESVFTFGTVWDYCTEWRAPDGRGPLFVIDECHVSLPKLGTPDSVVQWYKLHRHYNVDVLLITQSFRDINQPIAQLLGTLIRCRKADVLGKPDHYIRKVHAGYRGAVIQTDERPYKPHYFKFYKSHTQGQSLAESEAQDISPMIVKFNRVKWAVVFTGVIFATWAFWPKPDRNVFGVKSSLPVAQSAQNQSSINPAAVLPASAPIVQASAPIDHASGPKVAASALDHPKTKEPFHGKTIHLTGVIQQGKRFLSTLTIADGGQRQFDMTSDELIASGYKWKQLSYCFAWAEFEGTRRAVMCDAPQLQPGRSDKPIVFDSATGARSDGQGQPKV